LDAKIFQALLENQSLIPEAWKKKTKGNITKICFDGTIFRDLDGNRIVLCLYWAGSVDQWRWSFELGGGSCIDAPSAVLENI
jgi:hypothetical protein